MHLSATNCAIDSLPFMTKPHIHHTPSPPIMQSHPRADQIGSTVCINGIYHGRLATRENESHKLCSNGARALCPGHWGSLNQMCVYTPRWDPHVLPDERRLCACLHLCNEVFWCLISGCCETSMIGFGIKSRKQ
jgi:hypothetical protein